MKVKLDDGAFLPTRAHPTDAGLDIKSPADAIVRAGSGVTIRTGIHVEIPAGHFGQLTSKSGLNVKHDITTTGTIDEGYAGGIVIRVFNHGRDDYQIKRGDKISQLVIAPCVYVDVEQVDWIEGGERGANGFGSTGR